MTSPEIEKRKHNPAATLCVVLAVLCLALGAAAWFFYHSVAEANARAEQAEAKVEELATFCDSLIKAGNRVVDEADKQLGEADEALNTYERAAGLRLVSNYQGLFDYTLPQGWNYTVDYVKERLP